jgi:hypothetical protein
MQSRRTRIEKIETRSQLRAISLANAADHDSIAAHLSGTSTQAIEHDSSPSLIEPVCLFHLKQCHILVRAGR